MRLLVQNGLFANLLCIGVLVMGLLLLVRMPREVFPAVDFDVVGVSTFYQGASPRQVERLITNPLEEEIRGVSGIRDLFSSSLDGQSLITVVLDPDYPDRDRAVTEIQRAVDRVQNLPQEVESPHVEEFRSDQNPSVRLALTDGQSDSDEYEPSLRLRETAIELQQRLEDVKGVSEINFEAKADLEYQIDLNSQAMLREGISVDEVVKALRSQDISAPAGEYESEHGAQRFRLEQQLAMKENLHNSVLRASVDGQVFRLKDFADLSLGLRRSTIYHRSDFKPAAVLGLVKEAEADVLEVVDRAKQEVERFLEEKEGRWQVSYVDDMTIPVRMRLEALSSSILIGAVLVFFMLFLLLNWRTAMIVSIGIPFSFLGALLLLPPTGITLNLLSMFGFVVVLGMLVDCAIVVGESIYSELEKGSENLEASINGMKRVFQPVLGSVATTIVAFSPLIFMSGIFGRVVKFIPLVVVFCLLVSIVHAFFILPNHMRKFGYVKQSRRNNIRTWFEKVRGLYRRLLRSALQRRYWVASLSLVFLVLIGLAHRQFGSFVLFPREGIETIFINFEGDPRLSHSEMLTRIRAVESEIEQFSNNEIYAVLTTLGEIREEGGDAGRRNGSNYAQVGVYLTPAVARELTTDELIEQLQPLVDQVPDMDRVAIDQVGGGPPVGRPVNLFLQMSDLDQLREAVEEVEAELESIQGVRDIGNTDLPGKSEVVYQPDFVAIEQAGVNSEMVARGLQMAVEGSMVNRIAGEEEELILRAKVAHREPNKAVEELRLLSGTRELAPLSQFVRAQEPRRGLYNIRHYQGRRTITVFADVDEEVTTSADVNGQLKQKFSEWESQYPGLQISALGENRDTEESLASLGDSATIALMAVIFVMILTLGTLWQPLLVVSAIPFGFAGVVLVFLLHGRPISFLALFGAVGLAGVAVNVGIVLLHRINALREEFSYERALMEGASQRLRAVLATSATTIFALMPTAYGWGGGDAFLEPMALALGWGIAFSSVLALFLLPVYMLIVRDFAEFVGLESFSRSPTPPGD